MKASDLFRQYVKHLFTGKRAEARELLFNAHERGFGAAKLLRKIIWPAMEQVERLYREDHISRIVEHMATRINRMLADQIHAWLPKEQKHGKRMVVTCGQSDSSELGAQIVADLFEAEGWSVWFLSSGVPNDEVLQFIGRIDPDVLCIYGTLPEGVPEVRKLVHLVREVGICDQMQFMVVGGVFSRAEGLAEEVKSDLYAKDIDAAIKTVADHPVRIPQLDVPEPGRRRKRKKGPSAAALKAKAALEASTDAARKELQTVGK